MGPDERCQGLGELLIPPAVFLVDRLSILIEAETERENKAAVCLGTVGVQFQCFAEGSDRFLQLPLVPERISQMVVMARFGTVQLDCPTNVLDGNVMLPALVRYYAEQMERIGMVRISRNNLPIGLLCSLQFARLMMAERNRECFRDS